MDRKIATTSGSVKAYPLNYVKGSYSQSGTTITVTTIDDHNIGPGEEIYIYYSNYTTGSPIIGSIISGLTITGLKTFTFVGSDSQPRTGNCLVTRLINERSGTYSLASNGVITLTIPTHGFNIKDYIFARFTSGTLVSMPAVVESLTGTNVFRIIGKTDPGMFYSTFGVYGTYHSTGYFGKGVKVYVIDEGFNDIDLSTPGLQAISDLANFTVVNVSSEGSGSGGLSHGGLTCALLGASNDNGAGIVGICPDATLFLADVDDSVGDIFLSSVSQAIEDAINKKVDIISISLGSTYSSPLLQVRIQQALDAGILVFVSAGNSSSDIYEYPASYPGVISVASVDINRNRSSFNTRNDRVSLFAPGEDYPLPSPIDESDITYVNGTSFSCPFAAGLAALVLQKLRETKYTYPGDGNDKIFDYPVKIDNEWELQVVVRNNTTGVETIKELTTDYSITGVGNSGGGTVVFVTAPTSNETVIITKYRMTSTDMLTTLKNSQHLNVAGIPLYAVIPSTESSIAVESGFGTAIAVLVAFLALVLIFLFIFGRK